MSSKMAYLPLMGPQSGVTDDLEEGGLFLEFMNCDHTAKTEGIWQTMEWAISSYPGSWSRNSERALKYFVAAGSTSG